MEKSKIKKSNMKKSKKKKAPIIMLGTFFAGLGMIGKAFVLMRL